MVGRLEKILRGGVISVDCCSTLGEEDISFGDVHDGDYGTTLGDGSFHDGGFTLVDEQ